MDEVQTGKYLAHVYTANTWQSQHFKSQKTGVMEASMRESTEQSVRDTTSSKRCEATVPQRI